MTVRDPEPRDTEKLLPPLGLKGFPGSGRNGLKGKVVQQGLCFR